MAIPRAKKKKRVNVPSKPEQDRIMESNWLCLAVAIEQLYSDCGWRVKRINNIVNGFWYEMTEAQRRQNEYDGRNIPESLKRELHHMPEIIAKEAGEMIDTDIKGMAEKLDPYRGQCYMLCVGCLIKTLRKLKVTKLRCKLIVGDIFASKAIYEPWSVYNECERVTGFNVRERIQWQ